MELDETASTSERVRALLLEALPSGQASMDAVAGRLAMSKRTLQRRLGEDGATFQSLVNQTREALARHYLSQTTLSNSEISFLLGFENPNSFFRAFQDWTGCTPDGLRHGTAG
jgi:AraC-like DNA-binding protein